MNESRILQGVQKVVKEALYKTQCNKAALARKLGMSDDALTGWQRGDVRRLDIVILVRLCKLAEMSMDALFDLQGMGTAQGSDDIESLRNRAERAEWMLDQIRNQTPAHTQQTHMGEASEIPPDNAIAAVHMLNHSDQERLKLRRKLERATLDALLDAQNEVDKYSVSKKAETQQSHSSDAKHG